MPAMICRLLTVGMMLLLLTMVGCRHTLKSESGLYDVPLERNVKVAADGIWLWGGGNPYVNQKSGRVYIAPMNVSRVENTDAHLLQLLQIQMYSNMVVSIGTSLKEVNKANGTDWKVTDNPAEACVRIDTALVHFKPQRPGFRVLAKVLSIFSPIPGTSNVAAYLGEGDVCLECTLRDTGSGQLLAAFKDSNRKKARLYTAEAYSRSGNADVNLEKWAESMGRIFRECGLDRLGKGGTIRQKIDERTLIDAVRVRM